jgi:hypothetical protein
MEWEGRGSKVGITKQENQATINGNGKGEERVLYSYNLISYGSEERGQRVL